MSERIIKIRDDNGKPVTVGTVNDGVLFITRKKSKHLFRKFNAWGIDAKVINGLDDVHAIHLTVDDKDKFKVSREYFLSNCIPVHYKGHREQKLLPVHEWEKVG